MRIQDVRVDHVEKRITVSGSVHYKVETQRPHYTKIAYMCLRCCHVTICEQSIDESKTIPLDRCEDETCGKSGPFKIVEDKSEKVDLQDITIRETFCSPYDKYDTCLRELKAVLVGEAVGKAVENGYYDFTGDLKIQSSPRKKSEYVLYVYDVMAVPDPHPKEMALTPDPILASKTSMPSRNKLKVLRDVIYELQGKTPEAGADLEDVYNIMSTEHNFDRDRAEYYVKKMVAGGDLHKPSPDHVRVYR